MDTPNKNIKERKIPPSKKKSFASPREKERQAGRSVVEGGQEFFAPHTTCGAKLARIGERKGERKC